MRPPRWPGAESWSRPWRRRASASPRSTPPSRNTRRGWRRRRRRGSPSPRSPSACAESAGSRRSATPTWWPSRSRRAPAATRTNSNAEAAGLREQEALLGERLEAARAQLTAATGAREAAEASLAEAERQLAAQARAAAARAERLARLRGQVGAARSRVAAAREEEGRLADALEQAQSRARLALQEYEEFQEASAGRDDDRSGLAAAHEQAAAALSEVTARVAESRATERRASAERAGLIARKEALEEGIHAIQHGAEASAALLADPVLAGEVLGAVASLLTVADGAQEAVTAALGGAADAVAVAEPRRRGDDHARSSRPRTPEAPSWSSPAMTPGRHRRAAPTSATRQAFCPSLIL